MKKYKTKFNPRIIKSKKNYSTQEIADLFGVDVSTVHRWYRVGLKKIDGQRPAVVFGQDLINFHNEKNKKRKKRCDKDELFCCKCKTSQKSKENKITIKIINNKKVMIVGKCENCGTKINKVGVPPKIEEYKKVFDVQEIQEEQLLGCVNTGVNTSEKEGEESG